MRFAVIVAALLLSLPACAPADTLDYKFSGVEDELCGIQGGSFCVPSVLEFTVSSTPTVLPEDPYGGYGPDPYSGPGFFVDHSDITTVQNTTLTTDPSGSGITFYKNEFFIDDSVIYIYDFPTFSGSATAPTLLTGETGSSDYLINSSYTLSGTLTVTDLDATPTPEPGTLGLLGMGVACVIGNGRFRRAGSP